MIAHSKPPPTAQPLIAPITGLSPKRIASVTSWMRADVIARRRLVLGVHMLVEIIARAEGPPRAGEDDDLGRFIVIRRDEGRRQIAQ